MCSCVSRVSLQVALSVVGACRCGEEAVEHVRVGSGMFLFADIPISCVGIIPVCV